jgi:hypothetical protein
MSKKYNHMIDVSFQIETDEEDWCNIPKPEIIEALLIRISSIVREDDSFMEAFGCCDTYEVEKKKPSSRTVEGGMVVEIDGVATDWTFHTTDDDMGFENE